jgi:DNA-binding protein H-NS
MARVRRLTNMSYAELSELELRIARLKTEKQNAGRDAPRRRINAKARAHGFELREALRGQGKGKGKGKAKVQYRDPKNPDNTWAGRGRMPRWLVAATKGGKRSKDDFRI